MEQSQSSPYTEFDCMQKAIDFLKMWGESRQQSVAMCSGARKQCLRLGKPMGIFIHQEETAYNSHLHVHGKQMFWKTKRNYNDLISSQGNLLGCRNIKYGLLSCLQSTNKRHFTYLTQYKPLRTSSWHCRSDHATLKM